MDPLLTEPHGVVTVNVDVPLRTDTAIDLDSLGRYLTGRFGEERDLAVEAIAGGRSNLTFAVDWGEHHWVLRRPPTGPLPPSAHDVLRECPFLSALEGGAVPVPRLVCVCRDPSVIGVPFYLMERRAGAVITRESPPELADASKCRRVSEQLIDCLAELHSLDVRRVGLASLGRPAGFIRRQLERRRAQLDSIMQRCRLVPELVEVHEWLTAHEPEETGDYAIVHGDYGFHNVLVGMESAEITAVLDWEMATLGDPRSDLGWLSAQWRDPGDLGYGGTQRYDITQRPGFLTRAQMIDRYEARTGRSVGDTLAFYEVLAVWRVAIGLEGSYAAWREGSRANPDLARMETLVPAIGVFALQRAGLRTR